MSSTFACSLQKMGPVFRKVPFGELESGGPPSPPPPSDPWVQGKVTHSPQILLRTGSHVSCHVVTFQPSLISEEPRWLTSPWEQIALCMFERSLLAPVDCFSPSQKTNGFDAARPWEDEPPVVLRLVLQCTLGGFLRAVAAHASRCLLAPHPSVTDGPHTPTHPPRLSCLFAL